jgi:hypothetical protein
MAIHRHQLIAPNSLPIVGIKLEDGSVSDFEYSYDDQTKTSMYILPNGRTANPSKKEGPAALIDSMGNEWRHTDVEFHSLLHSRYQ